MTHLYRTLTLVLLLFMAAPAPAQSTDPEPAAEEPAIAEPASTAIVSSLKALHQITVTYLTETAEMLDEDLYAFRPTEEVRTVGELLGHVADAQYLFCSAAAGEENAASSNVEESASSKEEIVAALNEAFAYCTGIYDGMTDAEGAEMRTIFGRQMAASAILAFNSTHNYEHYGNLVTYMRINGIVPPSSMQ